MALFNCSCKKDCTLLAVIAAIILGIVGAFLQISATISVTAAFLWVALGIGVVYLAVLLVATVFMRKQPCNGCLCNALDTVLTGILGTILFSVVLLGTSIVATSIVSAILVGLLLASATLIFAGTACLVKCLSDCDN